MGYYLLDHPNPNYPQTRPRSAWGWSAPSGLVTVHTAEGALDRVAPDTNAHLGVAVANGIASKILIDGTLSATGNAGVGGHSQWVFGARGVNGRGPLLGSIAFAAIYPGDITAHPNWSAFKTWVTSYYGIPTV